MSRKQRVLVGLREIECELLKTANTGSKKNAADLMRTLALTRDICREGLSENSYVKYGEIYDGLILAVEQMTKVKELMANEETVSLFGELLQYIIRETELETNFKKDIFFLPYKASMWDSLESVWKAAYEDQEHCNAYVMPIPYADLNPDKSIAAWHCEKDEYPQYVPILDWTQVDLKKWHPDIIFFHNPYDGYNRVTLVDSRYSSSNLMECTDKLVYIPYAVEEEIQPGNQVAEDAIAHRVLCPGIKNANVVVAQSEDMRQAWINILTRRTNVNNRAYWEKRIVGLGSPKIDKVLNSRREDFDMPEKWKKLAEGKKVILYITSLSPMLQNSDKVCDKLRYVFDIFRNRDDVVLWWRPHPLMKSTFHSMRPELEKEYLKIEKQYIEEGWGIYDDTPDLHLAICWSDAYYGDWSSVMTLYHATRKPIMIQAYDVPTVSAHKIHLGTCASVLDEGNIWFSNAFFNSLFCFRLQEQRIDWIGRFEKSKFVSQQPLHCSAHIHNEEIIFTPLMDHDICIYNKRDNRFYNIPIPCGEKTNFFKSVKKGESIFIPSDDGHIWEYKLNEHKVNEEKNLSCGYQKYIRNLGNGISSVPDFGGFTILRWKSKEICRIDLDRRNTNIIHLDECSEQFLWAAYDGEKYWLCADESHDIISWESGIGYTRYPVKSSWGKENFRTLPYSKYAFVKDKIYVANCNSSNIIKIMPNRREFQVIGECHSTYEIVDKTVWGAIYSDILIDSKKIYFIPYFGNSLLIYDTDFDKIESCKFAIPFEHIPGFYELFDELLQANKIYEQPSSGIILEELIEWLLRKPPGMGQSQEYAGKCCGAEIFSKIMKGE